MRLSLTSKIAVFIVTVLVLTTAAIAQSKPQSVEKHLLNEITSATQKLESTEQRIGQQRANLAKQINKLELQVINIRKKTAAARRAADEQVLSLDSLKQRLQTWQQQHEFQISQIERYLQRMGYSYEQIRELDYNQKLSLLTVSSEQQLGSTALTWTRKEVAFPDGSIKSAHVLDVGAISLAITDEKNSDQPAAGIARSSFELIEVDKLLSKSATDQAVALQQTGKGTLTFDPSLGKAKLADTQNASVFAYISQGGLWILPILFAALCAISIAIIKTIQLLKLPEVLPLHELLDNSQCNLELAKLNGTQYELLHIVKHEPDKSKQEDALYSYLQKVKYTLNKGLTVITVTSTVSPLLGLLGTVAGMIETFRMMASFGSSDPEVVSGGIGQALVTTELGLVVAIPSLILGAILSRRFKHYYDQIEQFTVELNNMDAATLENNKHG